HGEATVVRTPGLEGTAEQGDPLVQADQPATAGPGVARTRGRLGGVADLDAYPIRLPRDAHRHGRGGRVLVHVGERLAHDAVHGTAGVVVGTGEVVAGPVQRDRYARRARLVEQCGDVGPGAGHSGQ